MLCLKAGVSRVIIEGDCANVIDWCSFGGLAPPWEVACLVGNIKFLLLSLDVVLSLAKTSANPVADFVAKFFYRSGWSSSDSSRAAFFDQVRDRCKVDLEI